jgi:hypothetical protein
MRNSLIRSRRIGLTLAMLLCFQNIGIAGDWEGVKQTFSVGVKRDVALAERLESYGYQRSALHYYQKIYRTAELGEDQLLLLSNQIERIGQLVSQTEKTKELPDLEVMLHFDGQTVVGPDNMLGKPSEVTIQNSDILRPQEFPSNRINKKKWILGTLAVIGVSLVAYKVTKHLRQKNPSAPNTVVIEF